MKKLIAVLSILLIPNLCYAEKWICWQSTTIGTVTYNAVIKRVEGDCLKMGICTGPNNTGILPECFEAKGGEFSLANNQFAVVDANQSASNRISTLSQTDIDAINAYLSGQADLALRDGATGQFDGVNVNALIFKSIIENIKKRDTQIVNKINAVITATGVPVAPLSTLTRQQIITNIKNDITSGAIDAD